MTCVRTAWLTLGASSLLLEDPVNGYFCQSLDLGYPVVRTVTNNRPAQHGIDDRTSLWGERVVSADVTALVGAGARIDQVLSLFGPYLNVSARPVLHWILDRPGTAERVLTLRPAAFTAPIVGDNQRDLHLSWVAADPVVKDPVIQSTTAWSGSGVASGRTYPLTFPRVYPVGSGGPGATVGHVTTNGDFPVMPKLRIYGPVTNPIVHISHIDGRPYDEVRFDTGYQIPAGHFLDLDPVGKTAYTDGDTTQPAMASIDWVNTRWATVNPSPDYGMVQLFGSSTTGITKVVATWQDAYLT